MCSAPQRPPLKTMGKFTARNFTLPERGCGPMNKNRIEGRADQGERATDREALVTKERWRKSGGRAVKECVPAWGDLALCLKE